MEYSPYGDLFGLINRYKKVGKLMSERDLWRIFLQILKGLYCLHENNIMHRDIKSANVLIFKGGVMKISDFNVAKYAKKNNFAQTQIGTPYYSW